MDYFALLAMTVGFAWPGEFVIVRMFDSSLCEERSDAAIQGLRSWLRNGLLRFARNDNHRSSLRGHRPWQSIAHGGVLCLNVNHGVLYLQRRITVLHDEI